MRTVARSIEAGHLIATYALHFEQLEISVILSIEKKKIFVEE